ncbi:MAG: WcaF family extracellular polysaccharide biosynthesis acetyltransferase [Verrucomicrobiota bacterium]|nr:WcaF family extracellular polysaccharide biosynthesis acetyltransferase [Verrucomicrobiota bacterium]
MRLDQFNNKSYSRGKSFFTESLWYLVKAAFFLSALPYPGSFKRFLLRCFGAQVGAGVVIRPRVNITMPWRLKIGDYSWIGEGTTILSLDEVRIGAHVCISQEAFLCTGSHDYRKETFDLVTGPIIIDESVWVAARAFICPGTHIRPHAVIQPASVVRGEIAGDGIYGGNPCLLIKSL